ncbi:MAG: AAA family ATPase, partial [Clostridia bacterium]|nr:AAA family ATPase [Clostridia bacterium]
TYNSGKAYKYNKSSIEWLTNATSIDVSNKILYFQNKRLNCVKEILNFGSWIKIVFEDDEIRSYSADKIKIVRNRINDSDVRSLLDYLKDISATIDESLDEQTGFIQRELERIEVSEESVLSYFLKDLQPIQKGVREPLIFPFATNLSQMRAVMNALQYNISAIQGPPGTGKTQTILNIIANLLIRNKKVAVVSGNNEATRNVQEKLANAKLAEISAFLGNTKNVKAFFEQVQLYPKFELRNDIRFDNREFAAIGNCISKIYKNRVRFSELNQEIAEYEAEKNKNDLFYKSIKNIPKELLKWNMSAAKTLELAAYLEILFSKQRIGLFDKLRLRFSYKLRNPKTTLNNLSNAIIYLQNRFYQVKLKELDFEKKQIQSVLNNEYNSKLLFDFERLSMWKLKNCLADYYANLNHREFNIKNYRRQFSDFSQRYPIIFSTTHALRMCSNSNLFDYVIIDESSQVDLASAVIAMSCAKNIVFVGDIKQLPHIVKSCDRQALKDVFEKYSLPDYLDYSRYSILQCLTAKYGDILPNVLLDEHYRCDSQIIGFCNKRFYNGKLHIQTEHQSNCGLKIIATQSHLANGRINSGQVEIIQSQILPELEDSNVGIVAPYRKQVELIKSTLSNPDILVDTVHKFQGKERNIMILSTVSDRVTFYEDEEKIDFLNNENLINVALSRAKQKLYVIASNEMLNQEGSIMNDLARYAKYYCGSDAMEKSQVNSIFELMYDEYSPILNDLKKRLLHLSEYQSENIVATVIQDICKSEKYGCIDFRFNYPLRNVIKSELLSDIEDRQFVEHENAHCDFVIYNKIDKQVRLVVEVDGKQHNFEIQHKRDERKDRLLNAANIRVLRIKTTDVDCVNKIKQALM